jgi:hypothetical protein
MNAASSDPSTAFVRSLAAVVLDPASTGAELQRACEALHAWALGGLPALSGQSTVLPAGLAIAPADAARCLLDAARTACLARALDASIAHRVLRDPGACVHVLYAGCGPLAPLALLAAARHRHAPLRITLLDVHAQSLHHARATFERAGLAGSLGGTVCADAAGWRLPEAAPRPAILVAEVMQRALAREPQLAVVANLLPQCEAGADLVPACIGVELALAPLEALFGAAPDEPPYRLATVLELSGASLPALCQSLRLEPAWLPESSLRIPSGAPRDCHAVLRTRIEGGHGHALPEGASGLTQPMPVPELGRLAPNDTLRLRYRLLPVPGFELARVDA